MRRSLLAVQYIFGHHIQLDFGSVLGPNGQIMLPDDTIMEVLHAHVRAEAIIDFSVQSTFIAFTALEQYMQSHWIPRHDSSEFPSKQSSYLQYGVDFMITKGYFVLLQLILIPFLHLTMPQEMIGLLETYKNSSLPWPTTAVLTVRIQSDHNT